MTDRPSDMPLWQLAIYGLPALPAAFLYVPLTTLLPAFYAQELGVSLAAVGGFMFVSRIILGRDVLANGESAEITFDRNEDQCIWDIRATYDDGDTNDWRGINLCVTADVNLTP